MCVCIFFSLVVFNTQFSTFWNIFSPATSLGNGKNTRLKRTRVEFYLGLPVLLQKLSFRLLMCEIYIVTLSYMLMDWHWLFVPGKYIKNMIISSAHIKLLLKEFLSRAMIVHVCDCSTWGTEIERSQVQGQPLKKQDTLKIMGGGICWKHVEYSRYGAKMLFVKKWAWISGEPEKNQEMRDKREDPE